MLRRQLSFLKPFLKADLAGLPGSPCCPRCPFQWPVEPRWTDAGSRQGRAFLAPRGSAGPALAGEGPRGSPPSSGALGGSSSELSLFLS